jgi:hypothetical protein
MSHQMPKPEPERLSALLALVLMTYGLIRMAVLPSMEAEMAFLGLLIKMEFKTQSIMLVLAAAIAAAGTDWLIRGHPNTASTRLTTENWVIPALAAVALGVIVIRIPQGPQLWMGLILSSLLLVAVFWAEFIVSYALDPRYERIAIVLIGLAYLLLTGSLFTIYALELRAFFAIPMVSLVCFVVIWRLLRLAFPGKRIWTWALLMSAIVSEVAIGLHYWPLPPLQISLLLMLTFYLAHQTILSHLNRETDRRFFLENAIIGGLSLLAILSLT